METKWNLGAEEKTQRKTERKSCGLLDVPRTLPVRCETVRPRVCSISARRLCVEAEKRGVFTFRDQVLRERNSVQNLIQRRDKVYDL